MRNRRLKRISLAALAISLIMLVYIGRLAWLQLMPGSAPAAALSNKTSRGGWQRLSVQQRQRNLVLDSGRGDFYDRNGAPLTGETYSSLAMFPVRNDIRGEEADLIALSRILDISKEQLMNMWDEVREPVFWKKAGELQPLRLSHAEVSKIEQLTLNGIRVLPYRNRYLSAFQPKHLIGFTSEHPEWLLAHQAADLEEGKRKLADQVGGSGLEKSLDKLLHGLGPTSVSYFMDGRNAPLHGLDVRITQPNNRYYPLKAMTTIDLRLQNEIEEYVDAHGLKEGAVVVLDTRNADIVAMVSRPQLKPGRFATADGTEWENHAVKAFAPGSVFKLVTEAAALEAGVANQHESFYCSGEYGKYGLSCWKDGGHGHVTLQEGLAQSCNIVFATIAERLTPAQLKRTADALGIGQQAGWHREQAFGPFSEPLRLLEEEESGQLFAAAKRLSTGGGEVQGSGELNEENGERGSGELSEGNGEQGGGKLREENRERRSGELSEGNGEQGGGKLREENSERRRGKLTKENVEQGRGMLRTKKVGQGSGGLRAGNGEKYSGKHSSSASDAATEQAAMLAAVDGGTLAQSGLGQRDVRMSPLQAANLIVTLLNDGRVMEPRLLTEIRYANGQRMVKLPAQRAQARGRIKPATAHALLRGMAAVVDHGTGRSIRQGLWAVAGKSGTAETTRAGIDRNHQWFAGYGPVKKPRYAIAVLVENQPPGSSNQATRLFRGVMDIAARLSSTVE
ncbi:penicillin-binding transpeptidase domain-containing protein [Paenibacillus sp. 2TAB23]|uniref:peptidoglycan D,D-transpeptidase FtsI family protein n=1 Tax=Paenibacillus sp. 2TAB23 TaxID=3233004 RepID=UPI003F9BEE8C